MNEDIERLFVEVDEERQSWTGADYRACAALVREQIDDLLPGLSEALSLPLIHEFGGLPEGRVYAQLSHSVPNPGSFPVLVFTYIFSFDGYLVARWTIHDEGQVVPARFRPQVDEFFKEPPAPEAQAQADALLREHGFIVVPFSESDFPYSGKYEILNDISADIYSPATDSGPPTWSHLYFH